MLELDDIQSGVLRPRPTPYAAAYVLFRVDERQAGRELMRRIQPLVASAVVRIHRMIRRGTSYGPPLPEGVLEDDGLERGLMFAFVGANLGRQFEFVQSEWMNDGGFFGGGATKDPVAGSNSSADAYRFPERPVAIRLKRLSRFVVTRGGEYCYLPGLRALRCLGELDS